ncbi:hypothetical protein AGDE_16178 [Angomonas deanei]|uniref:Uncharacterized protein n=1 Tax=Angomonas deanei TaxID=59799 RepID=A0A7G2C1H6_9TRYP|nr:hypothetical protein AGDE_16178 [Angomonas deanei]CAD2213618.1 hypothetical protein, conserved [Angomonas deanei]|eukprot:EPY17601.1 hypothetical protein AGDE_16178 [Angomonas deanei]
MMKDVLSSGGPAQAKFESNPISGPSLNGVKREAVKDAADTAKVIAKCVKGFDAKNDEMLVVQLNMMQIRAPKSVYVTSLMCVFVNHTQKTFDMKVLMENIKTKKKEGLLFTTAIGGSCRTALVVPISADDLKNGDMLNATLTEGEAMNAMKNKPSRSGGIATFIQMTKGPIDKGAVKDEKLKERMQKMIHNAEKTLKDPENNPFPSYPLLNA